MKKQMTKEEISEWNASVHYNESVFSSIIDIIACLIFWPMIIMVIHRRVKYNKYIDEPED